MRYLSGSCSEKVVTPYLGVIEQKSGTTVSTLLLKRKNHEGNKSSVSSQRSKMTVYLDTEKVSEQAVASITDACIDFVASDLLSQKSVEGAGLRNLVQAAIEIGSKYSCSWNTAIPIHCEA